MKKIFFFFVVTFFCCVNLFAEADNVTKRNRIIGATVGIQYPRDSYKMGYGADIFYRHCISSSPTFFYDKLYLSVNAGFAQYESKSNDVTRYDIPATLGLCIDDGKFFFRWLHSYLDVGLGVLYKQEEKTFDENSDAVKILGYTAVGFLISISKSLDIDINAKVYYPFKERPNNKISLGLSYSF